MLTKRPTAWIGLLSILLLSCKDRDFIQKRSGIKILNFAGSSKVHIKSYQMVYNPKADGFVHFELENNAIYEAEGVDGGTFAAIKVLLNDNHVLFDTVRKELFIDQP